jgi:uncharacterized protein (UPF0276 family)
MLQRSLKGGYGVGLRVPHYAETLERGAPRGCELVEAVSENFLGRGGRPHAVLDRVVKDLPVVLHGVSLSIGSVAPLDRDYLKLLRDLCRQVQPPIVSDHLCFGSWGGHYAHDLWPLPFTEEALGQVVERVSQVQEALGRQILLENVSSYVTYTASEIPEWEFLNEVSRRADCGILLDINNVFVNSRNHAFDAEKYIDGILPDRVGQFHLAGHLDMGEYLLDDHGSAVPEPVWDLFARAVSRMGAIPTIIEWDEDVPALETLLAEVDKARAIGLRADPPVRRAHA